MNKPATQPLLPILLYRPRATAAMGLLLLTVLLAGCGFALRGNVALAPGIEPLYIEKVGGQLGIELRTLLTSSGVELSPDLHSANTQLIIRRQNSDRHSTALGEGARVIEYQLIESVRFSVRDKLANTLFSSEKLIERKIMENDANKMASSNAEEKILRREMLQNLAATIVRQLATIQLPVTID